MFGLCESNVAKHGAASDRQKEFCHNRRINRRSGDSIMFIKLKVYNENVWLNTDHIVEIGSVINPALQHMYPSYVWLTDGRHFQCDMLPDELAKYIIRM